MCWLLVGKRTAEPTGARGWVTGEEREPHGASSIGLFNILNGLSLYAPWSLPTAAVPIDLHLRLFFGCSPLALIYF